MHTYTIEEAKKILNLDPDFDDDIIELYLEIADGQMEAQTGYDYTQNPCADSKAYVRMSILMQHYCNTEINKDYDYTIGMKACLTRLSMKARKLDREDSNG